MHYRTRPDGKWEPVEDLPHPDHKEGEGVEWDGDLPPIGIECEFQYGIVTQGTGYVKFYGSDYCVIQNTTEGEEREQIGRIEDYKFMPISIQFRRDKVIEEAMSHALFEYSDREFEVCKEFSARLHDADMLKLPGEEG